MYGSAIQTQEELHVKKLGPILAVGVAALVAYYLYTGGSLSKGGASGGKLPPAPDIKGKATNFWEQLYHDPRFYTGLVAVAAAILLATLWKRIGGFGRGFLLVVAGVAATIFVIKYAA
jgi:hypothetical protein